MESATLKQNVTSLSILRCPSFEDAHHVFLLGCNELGRQVSWLCLSILTAVSQLWLVNPAYLTKYSLV